MFLRNLMHDILEKGGENQDLIWILDWSCLESKCKEKRKKMLLEI